MASSAAPSPCSEARQCPMILALAWASPSIVSLLKSGGWAPLCTPGTVNWVIGAGRRPDGAGAPGAAGRGPADPDPWAWLELDRAARSVHHLQLPAERELVHVMEGPATKPEQYPGHGEGGDRGKRLPARDADQQPGAEQRDRAQGRHVEPGRLQGAQSRSRGPRIGGVQGPDSGPRGGQRERDCRVTSGRRGLLAACPAAAQPGYGYARQRGEAEHQHGHGLDQVGWHVPEVGTDGAEAEGDLPWPVAGPQRTPVDERVENRNASPEHTNRRKPPGDRATGQRGGPPPPRHEHPNDRPAQT